MGEIWITGDLHFRHQKVARIRGFESSEQHDREILCNVLSSVRSQDTFWVLGDLSVGATSDWQTPMNIIREHVKEMHLVVGNHDRCFPGNSNAHSYVSRYLQVFDTVTTVARIKYQGTYFLLSHFPYEGDHSSTDRFGQWRLRDEGTPVVHGHTHAVNKLTFSARGTPQLHASLDAWNLRPTTLNNLYKLLPGVL